MTIRFSCPSCGAVGAVNAASAGRRARCKHCGERFVIPHATETDTEGYSLKEPEQPAARSVAASSDPQSTFVSSRGEETTVSRPPRKSKDAGRPSRAKSARKRQVEFPWRRWLLGAAIGAVLVLVAIALFAPRGTIIAGSALIIIGCLMILVGYGAGAFGAFSEDFLYGMLYLFVPLYAGYYLLTRWDDLWIWFSCATAGVGLTMLGTEILRWSGVAA